MSVTFPTSQNVTKELKFQECADVITLVGECLPAESVLVAMKINKLWQNALSATAHLESGERISCLDQSLFRAPLRP